MSRSSAIVFVVLGAALAGFAFSSAAGQFRTDEMPARPTAAASPQSKNLDWHETHGPPGEKLVFGVDRLQVLADGWRARLALTNDTSISYAVGDPRATLDREFGLMLFETGEIEELERRNGNNTLPATRPAVLYQPQSAEDPRAGRIVARDDLGTRPARRGKLGESRLRDVARGGRAHRRSGQEGRVDYRSGVRTAPVSAFRARVP